MGRARPGAGVRPASERCGARHGPDRHALACPPCGVRHRDSRTRQITRQYVKLCRSLCCAEIQRRSETMAGDGTPPPGMTLFAWVKASLRDSIARGEYVADQPFVTQRQIVERFGVSTTTAVRALNDLVAEGLVVRRRGRGTFVADAARRDPSASVTQQRTVAFVS